MKTIHTWFETLPEPLKSEALKYNGKKVKFSIVVESLSQAIGEGFWWDESESGFEFWESFYVALREAEELEN